MVQPYSIEPLMEEETGPKRRWKRWLIGGLATLIILPLLAWQVVESEWFLRRVILPKVNESVHGVIHFKSADWSLGSSLELQGVTLHAKGQTTCLEVKHVLVRYDLGELLDGRLRFHEILLSEPSFTVTQDLDGQTNLDPFFQKASDPGTARLVELDWVKFDGGSIHFSKELPQGGKQVVRINELKVNLEKIGNGRDQGSVQLGFGWTTEWRNGSALADYLKGTLNLDAKLDLDERWQPSRLDPKGKILVQEVSERFGESNGLEADFDVAFAGNQLERLGLTFSRHPDEFAGSVSLGEIKVSGPLNLAEGTAELAVAIQDVDQSVMNLLGQPQELTFHQTQLSTTNHLAVTDFGRTLRLQGKASSSPLQVTHRLVKLPELDSLEAHYDVTYQPDARTVQVHAFGLESNHQKKPFLKGTLKQPLVLSWQKGSELNAPDSAFELNIHPTQLADWQPWLGRYVREGELSGDLTVAVQQAGRHIEFSGSTKVEGMAVPHAEATRPLGNGQFNWAGTVSDLKALEFTQCKLEIGTPLQSYFTFDGKPQLDLHTQQFSESSGKLTAHLPTLLEWFPQAGVRSDAGELTYNGTFSGGLSQGAPLAWVGTLDWANIDGQLLEQPVKSLNGSVQLDCVLDEAQRLKIQRLEGDAQLAEKPLMAKLDLKGSWDLRTGQFDFEKAELIQADLALARTLYPFPGVMAGVLNANLAVNHQPGDSTVLRGGMAIARGHITQWPQWVYGRLSELDVTLHWAKAGRFHGDVRHVHLQAFDPDRPEQSIGQVSGAGKFDSFKGDWAWTLQPSKLEHALLAPLLNRTNLLGAVTLQSGALTNPKPVQLQWNANGDVAVKGPVQIANIRFHDPQGQLPKEMVSAQLELDIASTQQPAGRSWKARPESNRAAFTLVDQPAGTVVWSGEYTATNGVGQLAFDVAGVDHRVFQLVPEPWRGGVELKSGQVNKLTGQCRIRDGGVQFETSADLKRVWLTEPSKLWPEGPLDLVQSLQGSWKPGPKLNLTVERNQGTVKQGDTVLGVYDLNGRMVDAGLELDVKSLDLGPAFTRRALDRWLPGQPVVAGRLQMNELKVSLPQQGVGAVNGQLSIKGFSVPARVPGDPAQSLDTTLNIRAAGTNRVLQLKQCAVALPPTKRAANQVNLAGAVDLRRWTAPGAQLKIASEAADITPLMAFLNNPKPATPPDEISGTAPAGSEFGFQNFNLNLNLKRLVWRDLWATNLTGNVRVDGRKFTFDPIQMHLLGAPGMIEGQVQTVDRQTQMAVNINVQAVPLDPVIRHFAPDHKIQWGKLTANGFLKALGWSGESFRNSFTVRGIDPAAPAQLVIEDSHWGFKEDDWLVGIIAGSLNLPQLLDSHFNSAELALIAQDGKAHFELAVGGPLLRAGTRGEGLLGSRFLDTTIKQDISIELPPKLAEEFRALGILFPQDGFMEMPTFLSMEGAIRKPKIEVDEIALGQILVLGITGRPGSLLRRLNPLKDKPDGEGKELDLNPLDILRLIVPGGD